MSALVQHPEGGYRFLPGIAPYSCGVVASPGFEIVYVRWVRPLPYRQGMERIRSYLEESGRPLSAVCSMALRCAEPYSFEGFNAFNKEYANLLATWDVFVEGVNPVARTNVSPVLNPPTEQLLYAFAYTRPASLSAASTFVVAGGGELPEGALAAPDIFKRGDLSPAGIRAKAGFVMDLMETRLKGLQVTWDEVTVLDVYTAHPVEPYLESEILKRAGASAMHGINWHWTRPPVKEIEFEMDLRGVRTELWI
jgi:hypothetical protein